MVGLSRAAAMDHILRRTAQTDAAAQWVLRGGVLARWWCLPYPRPADDVDFLALYDFDQPRTDGLIAGLGIAQASPTEVIWAETDSPGLRYQLRIGAEVIQVDIGFGDPLTDPPRWWDCPTDSGPARLQVVRPSTGLAWKLHGLFEFEDGHWRSKDLHDIVLFLQHADLDRARLPAAIRLAFDSRDTPIGAIDRLLCDEMGHSRGSRGNWQQLSQKRADVLPMREAFSIAAAQLRPHIEAMHTPLRHPLSGPFPTIEHIDDVLPAIVGNPRVERLTQPGLVVLDATGLPPEAPAVSDRRVRAHRLLRRECRGLIFASDGRLLARRYPAFPQQVPDGEALVLEKLDGVMVSPARLPGGIRLLGRRGHSPAARAAASFAEADSGRHHALWALWVDQGWTPILEWCSPGDRVVIAHPAHRLVLTGIRHRREGHCLPYPSLVETAREHGVEVVESHGRLGDLRPLERTIAGARDREGVVLRFDSGEMVALRSQQYLRLLRARSGEASATWEVIVFGEAPLLRPLLSDDGAERLDALEARYRGALAEKLTALAAETIALRAAGVTHATLREALVGRPGIERSALFAGLSGWDIGARVRSQAERDVQGAKGLAKLRGWLGL